MSHTPFQSDANVNPIFENKHQIDQRGYEPFSAVLGVDAETFIEIDYRVESVSFYKKDFGFQRSANFYGRLSPGEVMTHRKRAMKQAVAFERIKEGMSPNPSTFRKEDAIYDRTGWNKPGFPLAPTDTKLVL